MESKIKIEDKEVKLTNIDKLYWPEDSYSKYDLIKFYIDISPYLLKYLKGRLVNFQRFPDGIKGKSFYQKNCPSHAPTWINTFPIPSDKEEKVTNYILVEDVATLAWVANMGCIEIHPWLSLKTNLQFPDYAVFDLDPPSIEFFPQVLEVSLLIKEALDTLNLKSYPKTSGASGLQIFVPVEPRFTYEEIRLFTGAICTVIEDVDKRTTTERKVKARGDRIYLDFLQNSLGKTINAPYSLRPLPGAPVSTPLTWEEIETRKVKPSMFTLKTIFKRLEEKGDLFTGFPPLKQDISPFLSKISKNRASGDGS